MPTRRRLIPTQRTQGCLTRTPDPPPPGFCTQIILLPSLTKDNIAPGFLAHLHSELEMSF